MLTSDAQREMPDGIAGCLVMNEIAVGEGVLEDGHYGVAVVRGLRANLFEDEGEGLEPGDGRETTGADIQLNCAIFIENGRNACET